MLATVFTKTVRDRWRGVAIAVASLGLGLLLAMWVYSGFETDVWADLPEAFKSLMSIPENADASSIAIGVFYGLYGAFTLAGLAIAMGAAAIAGEEKNGTMGLLLGNPKSRGNVLGSTIATMVVLVTAATITLWAAAHIIAAILSVQLGDLHVAAYSAHIWVNTIFYGMLAFALGAATGKRGLAIGIPTGLMVLGFILTGIFPLVEGWESVAKVIPWYYFDGADPINNGFSAGHFLLLLAAGIALGGIAYAGLNRRDLRGQTVGTNIVDRLRQHPLTQKLADKIAGSIRVSRIWMKTISEHQGMFIVDAYVVFFLMGVLMGPLYALMDDLLFRYVDQLPEEMWAFVGSGAGGMSTAEGFYEAETFGMVAWMAVMVMTVTIAARGIAGEEANRTMGLLLANPVSRAKVVVEKTYAMVVYAVAIGASLFAGVWIGSLVGRLGMNPLNIAAASALATLVGLVLGGIALLLSAATGKAKVAIFGTIGLALAMFLINSFALLNDSVAGVAVLTPFGHYLQDEPLTNGMDWGNAAVLLATFVVLVAASIWAFGRRDIRQTG